MEILAIVCKHYWCYIFLLVSQIKFGSYVISVLWRLCTPCLVLGRNNFGTNYHAELILWLVYQMAPRHFAWRYSQ